MVFFRIIGFIVLMVIAAILNGWGLSVLWGWFFVPTLGLPQLGVVQAIGIAMVVGYLTYQHIDTQPKDGEAMEKLVNAGITSVIRPVFAVAFGWVVHSFM
jgi:hypothetical protein